MTDDTELTDGDLQAVSGGKAIKDTSNKSDDSGSGSPTYGDPHPPLDPSPYEHKK